jgi:type IV secretory pathway TrbD component
MSRYLEEPPEPHFISRPLTKPSLFCGVPSKVLLFIGFIALESVIFLRTWYILPFCVAGYYIAKHYTKIDPYFDQVYMQYSYFKSFYR